MRFRRENRQQDVGAVLVADSGRARGKANAGKRRQVGSLFRRQRRHGLGRGGFEFVPLRRQPSRHAPWPDAPLASAPLVRVPLVAAWAAGSTFCVQKRLPSPFLPFSRSPRSACARQTLEDRPNRPDSPELTRGRAVLISAPRGRPACIGPKLAAHSPGALPRRTHGRPASRGMHARLQRNRATILRLLQRAQAAPLLEAGRRDQRPRTNFHVQIGRRIEGDDARPQRAPRGRRQPSTTSCPRRSPPFARRPSARSASAISTSSWWAAWYSTAATFPR